jgi:hypothetical protein
MTVLFHLDRIANPPYPEPGYTLSPDDLQALAMALGQVAAYMKDRYQDAFADPLRVPWGFVNTATVAGREIPMPGGNKALPSLFMAWGELGDDGRMRTDTGSHYMQVASFGPDGFEVYLTVPHGQTNQAIFPASPHLGQTIDDFAARRYRKVWIQRHEVESHLCPHGDDPGHEHASSTVLEMTRSR